MFNYLAFFNLIIFQQNVITQSFCDTIDFSLVTCVISVHLNPEPFLQSIASSVSIQSITVGLNQVPPLNFSFHLSISLRIYKRCCYLHFIAILKVKSTVSVLKWHQMELQKVGYINDVTRFCHFVAFSVCDCNTCGVQSKALKRVCVWERVKEFWRVPALEQPCIMQQ